MKNEIWLAEKTMSLIDEVICIDQGAKWRNFLKRILPKMEDAYKSDDQHRTHLGASLIGRTCSRELWYSFRWFLKSSFNGRMLRLFNRGHLEEGRLIAAYMAAGIKVYYADESGTQFRIKDVNGHFGGSLDSVGVGCPDLPPKQYFLIEYKTHNLKSYKKIVAEGVKIAKPEHYIQMQIYMRAYKLQYGLYTAVNKNDDAIRIEIIELQPQYYDVYVSRAADIISAEKPPKKISNNSAWWQCRYCNYHAICHFNADFEKNCRTCRYSKPVENGKWVCALHNIYLTKEHQLSGCGDHKVR